MIKVRFAPSPTGYLHVGGARTALFNWLFARANNGEFILRIEDTDLLRSEESYLDNILKSLEWLGLDFDGDLIYQSKRTKLYQEFANKLISQGKAYKATKRENEEDVEEKREAIYFRVPDKEITFYDKVHDKVTFDSNTISDLVLIKSDGSAAYNFACVIDDIDLNITHVIRGDDHISNTPKQVLLYEALDADLPKFAHLPLIMGPDNARLSKRHGATSVEEFKKQGILPEALFNYLALLGWSPGGNQEIISEDKIIEKFSLNKINKVNAIFDTDKLKWVNSNYIKEKPIKELVNLAIPYLKEKEYIKDDYDQKWLESVVSLYTTRIKTLSDITTLAGFFFTDNYFWQDEAVSKHLSCIDKSLFKEYRDFLETLNDFSDKNIEDSTKEFAKSKNVSLGDLALPARVAVTGRSVSPGIFQVMSLLSQNKVIKRLDYTLANILK